MTLGRWSVRQEGIHNISNSLNRIFVPKGSVDRVYKDEEEVYSWMIEIVKYKQLSETTIDTFNKVFIYSLGKYDLPFNERTYNASLKKQRELLSLRRIEILRNWS